jgi:hypothetical protein
MMEGERFSVFVLGVADTIMAFWVNKVLPAWWSML